MKLIMNIDAHIEDERVEVYAQKEYPELTEVKKIFERGPTGIVGFLPDGSFEILNLDLVDCFSIIGGKLYAKIDGEKYDVKKRLYEIEPLLPKQFQKISQSSIVNLMRVVRFEVFFNGSLACKFAKDSEFVSRRYIKNLKERLGI